MGSRSMTAPCPHCILTSGGWICVSNCPRKRPAIMKQETAA